MRRQDTAPPGVHVPECCVKRALARRCGMLCERTQQWDGVGARGAGATSPASSIRETACVGSAHTTVMVRIPLASQRSGLVAGADVFRMHGLPHAFGGVLSPFTFGS